MISPGSHLRTVREKLGLTMSEVETASERLAHKHNNEAFVITASRLSDLETKGATPNMYRLYSLTIIYRRELGEMLSWYGVDLNQVASDLEIVRPPKTHFSGALPNTDEAKSLLRIDPTFDPRRTSNFDPIIEQLGAAPAAYVQQLSKKDYSYGYVGSDDLTMHPILPAGSFIQVDESRKRVLTGDWRSEHERPIYFIETRDGYTCSWCTQSREELILLPHPLSPVAPIVVRAQEAEIIGQVVGAAIRLGEQRNDGRQ